ncbi:MAG: DNA helicase RecQ [Lachnoclostridium sp.]|nr:DNA helicase RecQ [Lachnoclostridium sp.]
MLSKSMFDKNLTTEEIQQRALGLLRRFFGYSSFRPHQLDVITSLVKGRDLTVLMPTGGGKSLCYQIPALIGSGFTIVVSPLLSLMKDQVMALLANGIPAASINSMQSEETNADVMRNLMSGKIKIVYISPERLLIELDRWSKDLPIDLIAIDEAHCISQWGHDFRPDYTRLSKIKETFPDVPVVALTATADRLTREDISQQLKLKDPLLFVGSFDRPNLSLRVIINPGKTGKMNIISSLIDRYRHDSGIIYCMTKKGADAMNTELNSRGYKSAVYHAGLSADERNSTQERFINGELQVVCATVAFGMGIDKSNIRWVVHNNLPKNIESYYQEIGRAGRDGSRAETILFYSYSDIMTLKSFVDDSGQVAINQEKLERIKEYAESSVCRRRVLLSYFNEVLDHDCGNCDICRNPPERFDGKIVAQKALSAVVRTGESVGITMLINILRGSSNAELISQGFHTIKTYGVGREMSFGQWSHYISQIIQLGMLEIAYDRHNHLKITEYGRQVLRNEVDVKLSKYAPFAEKRSKEKTASRQQRIFSSDEKLLETLRMLRISIADSEGIAPFLVLNDKVLDELVKIKPTTMEAFAEVEGIGERRAVRYWKKFVGAINKFLGNKTVSSTGMSVRETALLLRHGYSPAEIAEVKNIKPVTVYGHIAKLIDDDQFTDFGRIVTRSQYLRAMDVLTRTPDDYYEVMDKELPQGLARVILSISDYLLRHKQ